MLKKICKFIGLILIISFHFLGIEYLSYSLYVEKNVFFYPCFILFLTSFMLIAQVLKKINWFEGWLNYCIVFVSVLFSLEVLHFLLF
ncbi:hypothetical protein C8E03_11747 [Lachnotalea glycerini]|uniref:Uncharacterized protein n=1 Tax=Lachnotalea glycerini TaxID=1763509 RepID=A0A318ERH6_9FIRM|nr:hypothetical protein C8E03_11747 [Lachnotalea glycerini]